MKPRTKDISLNSLTLLFVSPKSKIPVRLRRKKAGLDSIPAFSFTKLNFGRMISFVPQELSDLTKALF
jgi:hypothetical protein